MTTQPSRTPVAALVWGVAVPFALWVGLCAGLVLVVPGYKKTFAEFGMRLPVATEFAIAVSDWVATYWYVLLLSPPFFVGADVAVILFLWRSGRRGLVWVWGGLMIALPIVATILVIIAISLAMTKLYEGLSK
jgi:type IV pilus assembly protein PilC